MAPWAQVPAARQAGMSLLLSAGTWGGLWAALVMRLGPGRVVMGHASM